MGSTAGLIFGAIAIAWIAYLVPAYVRNRDDVGADEIESSKRFAESMRIIRRGTLLDPDAVDAAVEVSTPFTRSAALREVQRASATAAFRRSLGALVLLTATLATVVVAIFDLIPLWAAAIPAGLLIAWLGLCRYSTATLRRALDEQMASVDLCWQEDTVSFELPADLQEISDGEAEWSIEISTPVEGMSGSLWDPIPVTPALYTNKPLAARTVRTIDLSGPTVQPSALPPVAEKPVDESAPLPKASGE